VERSGRYKGHGWRRLMLSSGLWHYKPGVTGARIVAPDGRSCYVKVPQLLGTSWDTWERGQWKRTSDGMITPSDVRRYIEVSVSTPSDVSPSGRKAP
jgi:hypothetical protein